MTRSQSDKMKQLVAAQQSKYSLAQAFYKDSGVYHAEIKKILKALVVRWTYVANPQYWRLLYLYL
jgi:hypothetical protein